MKILCVNIPPAEEGSEEAKFSERVYSAAVQRNIDLVLKNADVTYRTCEWGLPMMDAPVYHHLDVITARTAFYSAAKAEEEGFEGVLIDCFGDPMLHALRQHLDIPVVGLCESSLMLSNMMGKKIGIVLVSDYNLDIAEELVKNYGQSERCVGIESLPPGAETTLGPGLVNAEPLLDAFVTASKKLVAKGAEVIIPGCSLISLAARFVPGVEDKYPNGLTEIDGAIVADLIGNAVLLLNSLATLKAADSSWISRKLRYIMPTPEEKEMFRCVSEDPYLKFWDHKINNK